VRRLRSLAFGAVLASSLSGCATLQGLAALSTVRFEIDRVAGLTLAGVSLDGVRGFEDLGLVDAGRIALALSDRSLPFEFRLHLLATNPEENSVNATLAGLDWTLFLQGRETISGGLDQSVLLPPGEPTGIPLAMRLDLVEFFEGSAADLVNLVLGLTGQGGGETSVRLDALPSVDTALGPLRYPRPISITRTFGGTD